MKGIGTIICIQLVLVGLWAANGYQTLGKRHGNCTVTVAGVPK